MNDGEQEDKGECMRLRFAAAAAAGCSMGD